MKLKGISKLVLAGTALAATAATLTTATYAWYVTNSTVEATNVTGKVSGDSVDGSLFISKNTEVAAQGTQGQEGYVAAHDAPTKYQTAVSFTGEFTSVALDPQSRATLDSDYYYYKTSDSSKGSKTYYVVDDDSFTAAGENDTDVKNLYERSAKADGVVWVDKEGKKISGQLLTFKFWLRSSKGGDVTFTLKTDNITSSFVKQQALSEAAYMPTGITIGDEFVVDAVPALRMERIVTEGATANPTLKDSKIFAVDAITSSYTPTATGFATVGQNTDANAYYYNTLGYAGYNTNASSGASELASTTTGTLQNFTTVALSANVDTLFTFNVWLEGSDKDCWDSARGQSFTFDFNIALAQSNQQQNP